MTDINHQVVNTPSPTETSVTALPSAKSDAKIKPPLQAYEDAMRWVCDRLITEVDTLRRSVRKKVKAHQKKDEPIFDFTPTDLRHAAHTRLRRAAQLATKANSKNLGTRLRVRANPQQFLKLWKQQRGLCLLRQRILCLSPEARPDDRMCLLRIDHERDWNFRNLFLGCAEVRDVKMSRPLTRVARTAKQVRQSIKEKSLDKQQFQQG